MKTKLPVLAVLALLLFCSPCPAQAQNAPNIKESINTFMHYFNETVVQSIQIQEILKEDGLSDTDSLFFFDLTNRLDKNARTGAEPSRPLFFVWKDYILLHKG
jgi:hypothetical protein